MLTISGLQSVLGVQSREVFLHSRSFFFLDGAGIVGSPCEGNGQARCSGIDSTCICDTDPNLGPFCNVSYKCGWWSNGTLTMPVSKVRAGVPVVFGFEIHNPPSQTDEYGSFLRREQASVRTYKSVHTYKDTYRGDLKCTIAPDGLLGASAASSTNEYCLSSSLYCIGSLVELHSLKSFLFVYNGAHAQIVSVLGSQQALEVSVAQKVIRVSAQNCRLISRAMERSMVGVETVFDRILIPQRAGTFRLAFVAVAASNLSQNCANESAFIPSAIFSDVFKILPHRLSISVSEDADNTSHGAGSGSPHSNTIKESFIVGENLSPIEIALLDAKGMIITGVRAEESLFVSVSLVQGTNVITGLMGSVKARVRSGVAYFTNLAVEKVTGRRFHLRFFMTGGENTIEIASEKFDIMPAELFFFPNAFPGDQLLTAGRAYLVSVYFLDQHQELTGAHSPADFSVAVRMMKDGLDISEHLDVAAAHNSSSNLMNLTVGALAADIYFEFYIPNTTVGIAATPKFHVRPLIICAPQSVVSDSTKSYVIGMHLDTLEARLCSHDTSADKSANVSEHVSAVALLDNVSIEAQLHLCLDFFGNEPKATENLHGAVLQPLAFQNDTAVFADLSVAQAGQWRLGFSVLINGAYVGVTTVTDTFIVMPSVWLDAIGSQPVAASAVYIIHVVLDVYGLARLPLLTFRTSPQYGSTIQFEMSAKLREGHFANDASSTKTSVKNSTAIFMNLLIDPEGASVLLLRFAVVGVACEDAWLNDTASASSAGDTSGSGSGEPDERKGACVDIKVFLKSYPEVEPPVPDLKGRPRAPFFYQVDTEHSSSLVIQDGGIGTAITEVLFQAYILKSTLYSEFI